MRGNCPPDPAGSAPELFSLYREMNTLALSPVLTLEPDAGDTERNKVDAVIYPVMY